MYADAMLCDFIMFTLETPPHILDSWGQTSAESCKGRAKGDIRSSITPQAWKRFADGLQRNGFFEGELEGSKRYREKTAMAEVRYQSKDTPDMTWHQMTGLVSPPEADTRCPRSHCMRACITSGHGNTTDVDDAVFAIAFGGGPPTNQPRRLLAFHLNFSIFQ